ncbi:single-stranded DNA-binding protein, partial [Cryptosporangium minutisporangium]
MLNRFVGIGRWASDIELKYTPNGKAVANANIAINDRFGDKDNTVFLPVVIWGKPAENTAEYSGKGKLVAVEGRIQVRQW